MAQYIDKDVVVAEIEKIRAKWFGINNDFADGQKGALTDVLSLIDTLEVKEYSKEYDGFLGKELKMVDDEIERLEKLKVKEMNLKEYYHKFLQKEWFGNPHVRTVSEMMAFTAKHFFELGMTVSNKTQKGG